MTTYLNSSPVAMNLTVFLHKKNIIVKQYIPWFPKNLKFDSNLYFTKIVIELCTKGFVDNLLLDSFIYS